MDWGTALTGQQQGQPRGDIFFESHADELTGFKHKSEGGLHPDNSRKACGTLRCPQAILQLLQLKN